MLDCLVIGGGAAGLTAGVYLHRYRRTALVVDAGQSRLQWIAKTRNVLGFPDGIAGAELLDRIRAHAARFKVPVEQGCVDRVTALPEGGFEAFAGSRSWRARTVLLATGARDVPPEVEGLKDALKHALVRYCPVCDGFETQGHRVAVLGTDVHGHGEAAFIAGFGNEVTWLSMGSRDALKPEQLATLEQLGVRIADARPRRIHCAPGQGVTVELDGEEPLRFDMMYSALGLRHPSGLATALGANAHEDGQLVVDGHMQTTVPGLYAAGDVAEGLNQIGVAAGHAAIAATAIHNRL